MHCSPLPLPTQHHALPHTHTHTHTHTHIHTQHTHTQSHTTPRAAAPPPSAPIHDLRALIPPPTATTPLLLHHTKGFAFKMADKTPFPQQATDTLSINYHGTRRVTEALLPLLRRSAREGGGRVVCVSSMSGTLKKEGAIRERFLAPGATVEVRKDETRDEKREERRERETRRETRRVHSECADLV